MSSNIRFKIWIDRIKRLPNSVLLQMHIALYYWAFGKYEMQFWIDNDKRHDAANF